MNVAVLADYLEEGWFSMDLVAEMSTQMAVGVNASLIRPAMRRRLARANGTRFESACWKLDRLMARFLDYPKQAKNIVSKYDVFHVIDHSYAHLVHALPAQRTVVTCHDTDAFDSLLATNEASHSSAFRMMTKRILSGLQKASRVVCISEFTRRNLLRFAGVDPGRVVVVPHGIHTDFDHVAEPEADRQIAQLIPQAGDTVEILHVGSTIPRKRIDVLIRALFEIKKSVPNVRLIRVGGKFTAEQSQLVQACGLSNNIFVAPKLTRKQLAAMYRRASLLVLTSDVEGMGLPLVETMACGTPAVTSAIPAFQEFGGDAANYFAPGNYSQCAQQVVQLLSANPAERQSIREVCLRRAKQYTWRDSATRMSEVYRSVATDR